MLCQKTASVLLVDDDEIHSRSLIRSFKNLNADFEFVVAENIFQARQQIIEKQIDVAVVDLSLHQAEGPASGYSLISEILYRDPNTRIIVVTGHDASQFGIEAINRGASSFLEKPADAQHLLALIKDGVQCSKIKRSVSNLEQEIRNSTFLEGIPSKSPAMLTALSRAWRAAKTNQSVLIIGETGTGKGVLANSIHLQSARSQKLCTKFQPSFASIDLITSDLFGHTRGAFTGAISDRTGLLELADKGTLFIDEVDQLPHNLQVMLLGVLQDKTFRRIGSTRELKLDFRLIAATNKEMRNLIGKEALREDFYHRIAQVVIELPSLRQRQEDIPELARHFCFKLANCEKLSVQGITREAIAKLQSYSWPGNIRELQAVVENAGYKTAFEDRNFIDARDVELSLSVTDSDLTTGSFRRRVQQYENDLVLKSLQYYDNNQSRAAENLRVDRSTLRRIMERAKITSNLGS